MNIVIFEDNQCQNLYPLGLFSPLYDVPVGSWTLRAMIEQLGFPVSTIVRDHFLFDGGERGSGETRPAPVLFINASVEPNVRYLETIASLVKANDPFLTTSGNRVAAALVPPETSIPGDLTPDEVTPFLLELELPLEDELFRTIDLPHEIVASHLRIWDANIEKILASGNYTGKQPGVFVGEGVECAPSSVADTTKGPVIIDRGTKIMHFSYLEGPIHIGANSLVIEHSSIKNRTSVGTRCKIGGEVEETLIDSFSNKQHHGFLGHSWVGKWVNLGAGTCSSDLKNTYGSIRIDYRGNKIETGMQFLGSVIGDYVKTAINTSLFTGKIAGVASMIYGTVTTNVPSFSNYARSFGQVTEISLEQVIVTQNRMFSRRGVEQTEHDIILMKRVFELTRHERTMTEEQINF